MSSTPDFDGLVKQARRCIRHKFYPQAITLFQQALALHENRADAHEGLATALFLSGDYPKAVEHFSRVSQLSPRDGKCLINMGAVYNRMGDYNKAVDALRRGIQKEKKSAEGYYNLGIAHRHLDQMSMAVSAYREAVRLAPDMAEAHQNLANVYLEMGNTSQAIFHYKAALEVRPDFERAQRGLSRAENAVVAAKKAISPFGRLVDEPAATVKAAAQSNRHLTDAERFEDRLVLHNCSQQLKTHVNALLKQLKEDLVPGLLKLNRAVAQGDEAPSVLLKAHQDFQAAVARCTELRKNMRRSIIELRNHEEEMNKPEVHGSE
jgi:cytochrome c-type biogenesis protein CcmH/NrfG